MNASSPDKRRVMFLYWGRRGALTKFAYEVQKAALADETLAGPLLSVSRQNEAFASFEAYGRSLVPVDTFTRSIGALSGLWRIPALGRELRKRITSDRIEAVITLMPHLWTPWIVPHVQRAGARYATIIHDAVAHPGDRTARVLPILLSEADRADHVFTLTAAVKQQLIASGHAEGRRVTTLFHPDLSYGGTSSARGPNEPLRLLWFGRIMPYKGLGLFVEALELLRQRGTPIAIGVFGEGSLEPYELRLHALGAQIVNRWIGEDEIAGIVSRYDAVALSHTEASQSGLAALAHGAGLPVVATPVGGIIEQVADGVDGVLAKGSSASDFADAIARLADDRRLYDTMRARLRQREDRSMARFVRALVDAVT